MCVAASGHTAIGSVCTAGQHPGVATIVPVLIADTNSLGPAMAKPRVSTTVPPPSTSASPVRRPKAGSNACRRPRTKHGRRAESPLAGDPHPGVDVTAERKARAAAVPARGRARTGRADAGRRRRPRARSRRVPRLGVVVAAHERDRDVRVRVAPAQEGGVERRHAARGGVQEIAEDDEPGRARRFEQARKAREIGGRRAARYGDATRAKRGALAEVDVGDEHGRAARPMERALGEQHDVLARERRVDAAVAGRPQRARRADHGEGKFGARMRHDSEGGRVNFRCGRCAARLRSAHFPHRL